MIGVEATARRSVTGLPVYVLPLDYARPPLSLNDRGRSRGAMLAKSRKVREIRTRVTLRCRQVKAQPAPHLHVVLHYVPPDRRTRDADNLVATLKPAIDALTAAGTARGWPCAALVPDDDPAHVSWSTPRIHDPDGTPRMWLEVVALAAPPPPIGYLPHPTERTPDA